MALKWLADTNTEKGRRGVLGRGEKEEGQLTRVIVYPDFTSLLSSTSRELKYLNIYQIKGQQSVKVSQQDQ